MRTDDRFRPKGRGAQPVEDRLSDLSRFDGASVSVEELRRDR